MKRFRSDESNRYPAISDQKHGKKEVRRKERYPDDVPVKYHTDNHANEKNIDFQKFEQDINEMHSPEILPQI
jgi:hypothetical protein